MSKPRKLLKPKFVRNIEKRTKKRVTADERSRVLEFYDQHDAREEERAVWELDQPRIKEEVRQAKLLIREQKKAATKERNERALAEHREKRRLEDIQKKEAKLEYACGFICTLLKKDLNSLPPHRVKILSRFFGVISRETRPTTFIGWESKKYLDAVAAAEKVGVSKSNVKGVTDEHIYPMQFFGLFLLTHLRVCGSLSLEQFTLYMEVLNQVAHVTKKENETLGCGSSAPQHPSKFLGPERAYREAGIDVNFTSIKRLEDVAPIEVLEAFFGDRLPEVYKY